MRRQHPSRSQRRRGELCGHVGESIAAPLAEGLQGRSVGLRCACVHEEQNGGQQSAQRESGRRQVREKTEAEGPCGPK